MIPNPRPEQPLRVVCVVASLRTGGAERTMSQLAEALCDHGHAVRLITLEAATHNFFQPDARVDYKPLGVSGDSQGALHAAVANITRARALRRAILQFQPDVCVSFVDRTNVLCLFSLLGSACPVVVCERTNPLGWSIGRMWDFLRRRLYPKAARLVVQTQGVVPWGTEIMSKQDRVVVIPNSVDPEKFKPHDVTRDDASATQRIIAVGRLDPWKSFHVLINAMPILRKQMPAATLTIYGDGPGRAELEALIAENNLHDAVALPGVHANLSAAYPAADAFAMSSILEGFPNALLEAMSCGLPCVAFQCEHGPSDLIRDGVNGRLIAENKPEAIAAALLGLLRDPSAAHNMGRAARATVLERYTPAVLTAQWEALLSAVAEPRT